MDFFFLCAFETVQPGNLEMPMDPNKTNDRNRSLLSFVKEPGNGQPQEIVNF